MQKSIWSLQNNFWFFQKTCSDSQSQGVIVIFEKLQFRALTKSQLNCDFTTSTIYPNMNLICKIEFCLVKIENNL
jgi:hypothetical protein